MDTYSTFLPGKNGDCVRSTTDILIRFCLKKYLEECHTNDAKVRIIEELGVDHGTARIDIAVVNGLMHGYEIKSDQDTLQRLPEQIIKFNRVFDKVTLVVGKSHLYKAINIIPDWWGIVVAKVDIDGSIIFNFIREAESNQGKDSVSISRLLWREEALEILKSVGQDRGLLSKTRDCIYKRLSTIFHQEALSEKVREVIFFREDWRPDAPLMINGE